jgi:hypothetical protein
MARSTWLQVRVSSEEKSLIEDDAKRAGKSLSVYLRDLALSQRALAPAPDTRRFAQTAPVTTKTETPSEQEIRDRIRLRELRKSAPKSSDACPAHHMRGVRCKFCKSVG